MGLNPCAVGSPTLTNCYTILWFGRYNERQVGEILEEDPNYLVWAQGAIEGFDLQHDLLEIAERYHVGETRWEQQTEYFWRYN